MMPQETISDNRPNVSIEDLCCSESIERHSAELAPLIYSTGPDYFDFMFGDHTQGCKTLAGWFCRNTSEFAGTSASVLFIAEQTAGLTISWPASEASARRQSDALAMIKSATPETRNDLQRRLQILKLRDSTPMDGKDYYIRSVAVARGRRGEGLGARLVQHCIAKGLSVGYRNFRLDVRTNNSPAVELYRRSGFSVVREQTIPHFGWSVSSMLLKM